MQFFLGILKGKHILIGSDKLIVVSLEILDKIELMVLSSQQGNKIAF
jgi:hypothetical protein